MANEVEKKKAYRLRLTDLAKYGSLTTIVPVDFANPGAWVSVSLSEKEVRTTVSATHYAPENTLVAKPATQEQLQWLYDNGNPHIEEYVTK